MTDNSELQSIRPEVLTTDDVLEMVPRLQGHRKLVNRLMRWLKLDQINEVHRVACNTPGPRCATRLLSEALNIKVEVSGAEVLDRLPEGAFITVSNHPLGALDGIALVSLIGERRPDFKVMVNMILNRVGGMAPNFIAVDPMAQKDPAKRAVSINGIRQCIAQIRGGHPLGFFPAGAMSKTTWRRGNIQDRPWQDSVLQLIYKSKVPVIPVYFGDRNSRLCNIMGHICWPVRSIMLPREVIRKKNSTLHVVVGEPITVDQQESYRESPESLGAFLRERTYALKNALRK
ncbi:MAG: lysophospholipid acyltransferase family protein [Muribaculaceae bacterium]|nr:lysophospholipid acyltransferase family protein [Muribaculaceae bacterium]MDE7111821.1 lysophospholipid acyltransferase family protein [Muribaculaceae bacterium]